MKNPRPAFALLATLGTACATGEGGAAAPAAQQQAPSAPAVPPEATAVIGFWEGAGPNMWFAKDPAFDTRFRERFSPLYQRAQAGELAAWEATPEGALALVLLVNQYPRNSFRDTPAMYASDPLARRIADGAIAAGRDRAVAAELQVFFYLPFAHSESLSDQERAVELVRRLGPPHVQRAEHHRDIVRRFGQFPHRNPILGRATTPEEQRYLDDGGYKG